MNRMIATVAILSAVLGAAAYAGPPARSGAASSSTPQTLAFNGTAAPAIMAGPIASNPNVPGATGRTIVLGDSSMIAGDRLATRMQQTGGLGGD
jgi:hypothetical protein